MSYTMTLDMPQKEAAYVARHRAQFQSELNAIALVIVQSRMKQNREESLTGADFLERLRGDGPFLDDEEMHVFDRVKDYGRPIAIPHPSFLIRSREKLERDGAGQPVDAASCRVRKSGGAFF